MDAVESVPRSRMPASVKWIVGIGVVKIAIFGLKILTPVLFLLSFKSELLLAYREGWLDAAGFAPEQYGPDQAAELAGMVTGTFLPGAALSALVIFFVFRRRLRAIQAIAVILASGSVMTLDFGGMFWWIPTAIIAFVPQTKAFFTTLPIPQGDPAAS